MPEVTLLHQELQCLRNQSGLEKAQPPNHHKMLLNKLLIWAMFHLKELHQEVRQQVLRDQDLPHQSQKLLYPTSQAQVQDCQVQECHCQLEDLKVRDPCQQSLK